MVKFLRKRLSMPAVGLAFLFIAVQIVCDLLLPNFTAQIINRGVARGDTAFILRTGGQMLAVLAIGICGELLNVYFAATQAQKVGTKIRMELYDHIMQFSNHEMQNFGTSSLVTRTTNDVTQIQNALIMILRVMVMSPLYIIGASVLAYMQQPKLTLVFVGAVPVLVIVMALMMRRAIPLFGSMQRKIDKLNLIFREGLTGVRVIRAFRQDDAEQRRFDDANQDYTNTAVQVFSLTSLMFPLLQLILNATYIAIVWFGAGLIASRQMQVGNLVSFMVYAAMLLWSFLMLAMVFSFVPRAGAAIKRIDAVLNHKVAVQTPAHPQSFKKQPAHLAFNDVTYTYPNSNFGVSHLNFTAHAGQTIALIGKTGAGKSTILHLLTRQFDPTSGTITLNGLPLQQASVADVQAQFAVAQQKAVLFAGTVRSNLQVAKADATDEEMWHALKLAQAADFVAALPEQFDAPVDQDGANFSGGQRQRLAIARAVLKQARVYVFDDSFSALDFKTDAQVRANLRADAQIQQAICVIVAQRIATVVDADMILVLDEGKIIAHGTHEQLLQTSPTYQAIVQSQQETEAN